MKFVTIGVYGSNESSFFRALQQAGVNTFCDIRWRRGVRGSEYAFVNKTRLEQRLATLGIRYLHFRELAPTPEVRERQAKADRAQHIARRKRTALSDEFIEGYRHERLSHFDSRKFMEQLGSDAKIVALFCVEREPSACHRSLLAERLRNDLNVEIEHLLPEQAAA